MSHAANEYVKHLRQAPNGAKLTPAEKAVLSQLADDHNQDKGCAWPSVGNVASRACMTDRHCRRLLRDLEAKGVIELNPRLRENGGRSSSEYRFPQIDPPFDVKAVAHTAKRMQLQRMVNAQRPVQERLYPPDTDVRGARTTMSGGDGHPCPGGADTDVRGARTPMSGGIDPLLEPPLDPAAEPALDPDPPNPPTGRVDLPLTVKQGWAQLHLQLKSDLASVPPSVAAAKGFATVQPAPGHIPGLRNDYDVCFREWRLEDLRHLPNGLLLVTSAEDEGATQAGLDKYRRRIERLVRRFLAAGRQITVTIQLRRASAAPESTAEAGSNPWFEVKRVLMEALERMPNRKHAAEALVNFRAAIAPTVLSGVEMDGAAPVWTLVSANAKKTRAVMALLRRPIGEAIRTVAGCEVQIVVRDVYRGT